MRLYAAAGGLGLAFRFRLYGLVAQDQEVVHWEHVSLGVSLFLSGLPRKDKPADCPSPITSKNSVMSSCRSSSFALMGFLLLPLAVCGRHIHHSEARNKQAKSSAIMGNRRDGPLFYRPDKTLRQSAGRGS